jgi:predicted nucleic acid-binding protein
VRYALLDTAIYIDVWESDRHQTALASLRRGAIIRHSAVVLSELYRGARTATALKRVLELYRLARPCWVPDEGDWHAAGRVLRQLGIRDGWEGGRLSQAQNDALIALTARKYGATVVTTNRRDFEILASYIRFAALYV